MKKVFIMFLLSVVILAACRETWTIGTKNRFYEGCTAEAIRWSGSEEKANAFCDCVYNKMKEKYKHEDDAIRHLGDLAADPDLQACKTETELNEK